MKLDNDSKQKLRRLNDGNETTLNEEEPAHVGISNGKLHEIPQGVGGWESNFGINTN